MAASLAATAASAAAAEAGASSWAWYTGDSSFDVVLAAELALVASTVLGMHMQAPYGKHANDALGSFHLPPRLGWWLMEIPATVSFLATFLLCSPPPAGAPGPSPLVSYILAALWCVHYFNRGWYFPLNIRVAKGAKTSFNVVVSLTGAIFTGMHGHLNARMFRSLGAHYSESWLTDPRFLVGLAIYEFGFWVTVHSEHVMRELRPKDGIVKDGERYKIPRGGAFEYVTSAQYFGELTAWAGFALLTWSLPGLAVFAISCFNLVPRAFQNHTWYLQKFGDEYKKLGRARLIPFIL
eukprot:TRINITY_DN17727_c0_g1_i1.p2 TRINITY_DN17727_c0_g1~~TRINITY_DN17727_c0_g1_i1.p2  ORF type:complete len:295 (+),score=95.79 TRINITY_DN17727_c0_g1_i1:86-970(+)